jgi:hypothetical protein
MAAVVEVEGVSDLYQSYANPYASGTRSDSNTQYYLFNLRL